MTGALGLCLLVLAAIMAATVLLLQPVAALCGSL